MSEVVIVHRAKRLDVGGFSEEVWCGARCPIFDPAMPHDMRFARDWAGITCEACEMAFIAFRMNRLPDAV